MHSSLFLLMQDLREDIRVPITRHSLLKVAPRQTALGSGTALSGKLSPQLRKIVFPPVTNIKRSMKSLLATGPKAGVVPAENYASKRTKEDLKHCSQRTEAPPLTSAPSTQPS